MQTRSWISIACSSQARTPTNASGVSSSGSSSIAGAPPFSVARHSRTRGGNKKRFQDLKSRELEHERDDFGQGEPASVQPDFSLYGIASDLPNRGTTYYYLQFTLTDLKRRTQVWTNDYEVRVSH